MTRERRSVHPAANGQYEEPFRKTTGGRLVLLHLAAFLSTFDRFAVAPMLVTMAVDLRASLAQVTVTASLYFLLYGAMQPVWGMLSDRLGRVWVMRWTLWGVTACGLLSALAPNLGVLVLARALTGGLFAAVIPASMVYIGDTVPIARRQKALADLMAATAVGMALAAVGGGLAAYLGGWRLAFAMPAVAAGALALWLARLPEPEGRAEPAGPLAEIGKVVRRPWAILVVLLALVEGAVIFGFLTFLAPALEAGGNSSAVSGLAVGFFGLAVLGWTQAVKLAANRLAASQLILIGGLLLMLGYTVGALNQSLPSIVVAAILIGGGFAFMHSTLQTWATEVAPDARATTISFFAAALFVGSGVATTAAAPLATAGFFGLMFGFAALLSAPLGILAGFTRHRYAREFRGRPRI